jgi:hypothetical protein
LLSGFFFVFLPVWALGLDTRRIRPPANEKKKKKKRKKEKRKKKKEKRKKKKEKRHERL